mgnify:CR=1 FL=1
MLFCAGVSSAAASIAPNPPIVYESPSSIESFRYTPPTRYGGGGTIYYISTLGKIFHKITTIFDEFPKIFTCVRVPFL